MYNQILDMQFCVRNNFYVIIDDHSEDPTVQTDPTQWVQYWVQLMTDVTSDTQSQQMVMADLINEPDHAGFNWDQVRRICYRGYMWVSEEEECCADEIITYVYLQLGSGILGMID